MTPPPHEQWLQRNARIGWFIVGILIGAPIAAIATSVRIGVDRYVPSLPEKAGNVQCWFGADGKSVTCAGVKFVRQ